MRTIVKQDTKYSRQKIDKFNRIAISKFRSSGMPLYDGEPVEGKNGFAICAILYSDTDDIGYYCIRQCTDCKTVDICRMCETETDYEDNHYEYGPHYIDSIEEDIDDTDDIIPNTRMAIQIPS